MSYLVIYGAITDPHLLSVSGILQQMGINSYYIDVKNLSELTYSPGVQSKLLLKALKYPNWDVEYVDLKLALFWRRNKRRVPIIYNEECQYTYYSISELDNFLDGIILQERVSEFTSYLNRVRHEHKAFQLGVASKVGLSIPRTKITNDLSQAKSFISEHGESIVKPLKNPHWMPPLTEPNKKYKFLVNTITLENLSNTSEEAFRYFPVILQKKIEKVYELRIVAVGNEVITYKINSQDIENAKVDWRRGTNQLDYERVDIPISLHNKIRNYLETMGLTYGVFDFAVDQDLNYVFFECNSDGQWAWLDIHSEDTAIAEMYARNIALMIREK